MKGFNVFIHILLVCIPAAFSSPSIASNRILNPQPQLKDLDSDINKVLVKITLLRADLVLNKGLNNFIYSPLKRKCNNVESMLKALDEDTREIQIMQLKESTIAAAGSSGQSKNANKPSKYVDSFRNVEYFLRDIASKLRKLAKYYKITPIPKYTVGISNNEAIQVQKEKVTSMEANKKAYEKLTAMAACIKVFNRRFIKNRLLQDPFQSNKIDEFMDLGQKYREMSLNNVF